MPTSRPGAPALRSRESPPTGQRLLPTSVLEFNSPLVMADNKETSGSLCRLVHGFGLRTGVQDNVLCVDEMTAIFPVGRALAQLNIETRVMSFVSEGERADLVLALALAPSRRYARVPFNTW